MASDKVSSTSGSASQSSKSASEKRSLAKQINAAKMDKLDEGHQRAVKVLRRTKGALDACCEMVLNGKKCNPELVEACTAVEAHAAKVMLS